jgi:hypothetical protein
MATIKFSLKPGECKTVAGRLFCNRWKRNTSQAVKDYENGIKNPKRSWGKTTCEAQNRYKAGVDAAHLRKAFQGGVKKKGTRGWFIPTLLKGPTRFAQGVSIAGGTYASGYIKYHKIIKRTSLPGRFPRGDPRNINRCSTICAALGRAKAGKATTGRVTCPDR